MSAAGSASELRSAFAGRNSLMYDIFLSHKKHEAGSVIWLRVFCLACCNHFRNDRRSAADTDIKVVLCNSAL